MANDELWQDLENPGVTIGVSAIPMPVPGGVCSEEEVKFTEPSPWGAPLPATNNPTQTNPHSSDPPKSKQPRMRRRRTEPEDPLKKSRGKPQAAKVKGETKPEATKVQPPPAPEPTADDDQQLQQVIDDIWQAQCHETKPRRELRIHCIRALGPYICPMAIAHYFIHSISMKAPDLYPLFLVLFLHGLLYQMWILQKSLPPKSLSVQLSAVVLALAFTCLTLPTPVAQWGVAASVTLSYLLAMDSLYVKPWERKFIIGFTVLAMFWPLSLFL